MARYGEGEYENPLLGLALLDPSAPWSWPSERTYMAWALVGDTNLACERVTSAFAKVCELRDLGLERSNHPRCHRPNSFRWPGAVYVDGTYVGVGGQRTAQDAYQATQFAVQLNEELDRIVLEWEAKQPPDWRWRRPISKLAPAETRELALASTKLFSTD